MIWENLIGDTIFAVLILSLAACALHYLAALRQRLRNRRHQPTRSHQPAHHTTHASTRPHKLPPARAYAQTRALTATHH